MGNHSPLSNSYAAASPPGGTRSTSRWREARLYTDRNQRPPAANKTCSMSRPKPILNPVISATHGKPILSTDWLWNHRATGPNPLVSWIRAPRGQRSYSRNFIDTPRRSKIGEIARLTARSVPAPVARRSNSTVSLTELSSQCFREMFRCRDAGLDSYGQNHQAFAWLRRRGPRERGLPQDHRLVRSFPATTGWTDDRLVRLRPCNYGRLGDSLRKWRRANTL